MTWENKNKKVEVSNEPTIQFTKLHKAKQKRGLKILSFGNFSTGKTHFALSGNQPVYIIDTENGASPLADKFPDANILNISTMDYSGEEEIEEVQNFIKFQKAVNYLIALPDDDIGTIVIDSITDIWGWTQSYAKVKKFKLSIEDRLKQQFDWGIINNLYMREVQKLINKNCNVVFTARESEIYAGAGQPTGKYQPACQKKTPYFVDIVLYHQTTFKGGKISFTSSIYKCRQNGTITGKYIENPTIKKIMEMLK